MPAMVVETHHGGHLMTETLEDLVKAAKRVRMTADEKEEQRRSFAYGNTKIENELITRETVDQQAEALKSKDEH